MLTKHCLSLILAWGCILLLKYTFLSELKQEGVSHLLFSVNNRLLLPLLFILYLASLKTISF